MEQRIDSLIDGLISRQRKHKLGIDDGNGRVQGISCKIELLTRFGLCDNAVRIGFGPGSRRRGYGDHGSGVDDVLLSAAARIGVIPKIAVLPHHHRNRFGCIDTASAPEAHNEVAAALLCQSARLPHFADRRIRRYSLVHRCFHLGSVEQADDPSEQRLSLGPCASRCAYKRVGSRKVQRRQFVQSTRSENDPCRHLGIYHHGRSFHLLFLSEVACLYRGYVSKFPPSAKRS